jgi:glutathione reductase (NADPH)
MTRFDHDLFVIGAGSGGVRAARIAAGHGAKVAIAEEYRVGGTCVIRGCVPKKLFVLASRFHDAIGDAAGFGWDIGPSSFSWPRLVAAKDKEIERLEAAYGTNLDRSGVTILRTRAELMDQHTLQLGDGSKVTAAKVLIATGGHPVRPPIPGAELAMTSNEIFHLDALPERMIIVGGGYIAVEFACLLQRLGVGITLLYRGEAILRGFDGEVSATLAAAMTAAGVEILTRTDLVRIDKAATGFTVALTNGETRQVGQVMVATGRKPNTEGLGLAAAGVKVNTAGAVIVDDFSQTCTENIWAVGDVTNRINLTPVAIREGHAFADTVFGGKKWAADYRHVPSAVFSTPEIGTVGLSEELARAEHENIDVYKTSFRAMKATLSGSNERVFMKLVVDGKSDRILGVHVVGDGAGEMAQLLAISVRLGATKADFDATMPLHPTAAEELVTMRTPSR